MNNENENNLEQMNNRESVSPVVPNHTEESGDTSTTIGTPNVMESTIVEETPTMEPVKPTLDSILNGNPEETPVASVDTLEPVVPTTATPSAPEISNTDTTATPIMESVPVDAVVDTSAKTIVEEQPLVENSNNVVEPILNNSENAEVLEENPVVEPIENANEINNTVATPNVSNIETLGNVTPVENSEFASPNSIPTNPMDDFNEVPVPPVLEEEEKKKKGGNKKVWILLLLVILIAAIGFGVYYFLTLAKGSVTNTITTKELKVELGSTLSTAIEDYATINGYNKNDCTLNLDNVNINKVSTYKFTVTCGKASSEGIVIVDDSTKPEVVTNDLTLLQNATLNAEDFIEECLDASKCSYEFQSDVSNLTKTLGEYDVTIIVSDEYNNKNTVTAKLTVSRTAPARYFTCTKKEEKIDTIASTLVDSYRIGIDANDNFYNATRISKFTFNQKNDYNKVVNDYKETEGIHNILGTATFNENNTNIIIKSNKTLEDMNKDLNGKLPNNSNILRAYLSGLGYICK